ncbi:hypothetical protein LIER_23367 [Lithospermum erythrorhizon]|uniref:Uncharacterized protein n=1 Tax=Lithospermum erythrorhizon TaxID=34254 RepID=A0AAV3R0F1_LITER
MYGEELYKKSWDGPLLSCVSEEDIPKILAEGNSFARHRGKAFQPSVGSEAVLPVEAGLPTHRQLGFNEEDNEQRTYELEKMNGDSIPSMWHASNLAKYYV